MEEYEAVEELRLYINERYIPSSNDDFIRRIWKEDEIEDYEFSDDYKCFIIDSVKGFKISINTETTEVYMIVGNQARILCKDDLRIMMKLEKIKRLINEGCE